MIHVVVAWLLFYAAARASEASSASEPNVEAKTSASSTLGAFYRQARADHYYTGRYGGDAVSSSSGAIGVRADPVEHRDAAYFESRCITCDPNKSSSADRGSRLRPRHDWYEDDLETRRFPPIYRDRFDEYDVSRSPGYDYDRARSPGYDYDRSRSPGYDYERYNRFGRYDLMRPAIYYNDRYENRYDRDRYPDRYYDRGGGYYERGNGYDNLDSRYPSDYRGDRYGGWSRRPSDDPYGGGSRYDRDRYNRYGSRYDRYDPRDYRRPAVDDRYGVVRGSSGSSAGFGSDGRGYYSSGSWGPAYDRGYASGWGYAGNRDTWRDRDASRDRDYDRDRDYSRDREHSRDRDPGYYRPRDYFYDSTAAPGSRGTSYLHDRQESSTSSHTGNQDPVTNSPPPQETNKVYKD